MNPVVADTCRCASGGRVRGPVHHQQYIQPMRELPVDSLRDSAQPIHLTHKLSLDPSHLRDRGKGYLTPMKNAAAWNQAAALFVLSMVTEQLL